MSILEDLYYGNLRPNESMKSCDPRAKEINKKLSDAMQIYQTSLSKDDFEQLEEMLDWVGELNSMHTAAAFVEGYRIGALMMIDVIKHKDF
ncbi:hypothetical protein GCM10010912_49450 [Paenibacillus albidus]|uniref:Uncharacterized protein n=1 Tax=Paenibacillus albidus TaxID=2041023 RepID=A0A917FR58_9BACL|nr:DUF6809 family protein [Paenibacillus albidus]GGF98813.1 hypothetical protein GCM10010912_49450 [Paenibacillus albidus]